MSEKKVLSCHSSTQPLKELLDFRKVQKYNHSGLDIDLSPSKFFRKKMGCVISEKSLWSVQLIFVLIGIINLKADHSAHFFAKKFGGT